MVGNTFPSFAQTRTVISLDKGWRSIAEGNREALQGMELSSFNDQAWQQVDVPHNWDAYDGYRRMRHGNRHGFAGYRKMFTVPKPEAGKRYFLFFEGVGSFATVWVNGKKAGAHAGGRTSFTIDITDLLNKNNQPNLLAVRADHPANITSLPWVCGGCSDERGFSEGSQPMGIFRPVQLVITGNIRIEPFGVHVWTDSVMDTRATRLHLETEIKNYTGRKRTVTVVQQLLDKKGNAVAVSSNNYQVGEQKTEVFHQELFSGQSPHLWSLEDPYLYNLVTEIREQGKPVDRIITPYGIRWISWPLGRKNSDKRFYLNGKPVFINGIAEYEHELGGSHAFTAEQIRTRVMQVKSAGFNAFRDAHQPHNLRYGNYWDSLGILCWTQLSAHVWYDSTAFKTNFKNLLTEWVKERRNSPSVVLWGLQNESKLPAAFAEECTALIRKLDPTTSSQRKVTTCNGGEGTDWDVPQNWTGTYGGNPATYADDIQRQVLIGEYGAWRTLDLHSEGPFQQNGNYSEDRMTQLMEMKIRLADSVKDKTAGHFMWLLTSHDNPGRVQGGEGFRELDRIGPVNYKGLLTPWEEPLDVFYLYRSNYAPSSEPMVYIVSHTWPMRWTTPGIKDSIMVYSNCDEVELFNDVNDQSLGKRKRGGKGTHFQWDGVDIRNNLLYAVGYIQGKPVAKDMVILSLLPPAPKWQALNKKDGQITAPDKKFNYLYRVNCGGPDYVDANGHTWLADRQQKNKNSWGSRSWTNDFPGMPTYFASQRRTHDPIDGTSDDPLFQTFRYGRDQLQFHFPVQKGRYRIELYFIEPWLGTGGGMNCTGWRLFDIAVNGKTMISNLDIWKEAGHDKALKKILYADSENGELVISFPRVASGQALISAIAIATENKTVRPAPASSSLIRIVKNDQAWKQHEWLDEGDRQYTDTPVFFTSLPPNLFGATWLSSNQHMIKALQSQIQLTEAGDVFVALDACGKQRPDWLKDFEDTRTIVLNSAGKNFGVFRKRLAKDEILELGSNGEVADSCAAMYSVMVQPVSGIEPAYDLKTVVNYKAVNARLHGPGIMKGVVDGKDRVIFKTASPENYIEWDIATGVADTYSLTIAYNNPHEEAVKGKLQFYAADGTLMKEEEVWFTVTRAGKSNYINSSTGSMINAGNYRVRLSSAEAVDLSVSTLDVQ